VLDAAPDPREPTDPAGLGDDVDSRIQLKAALTAF
jgi:hypothetical protein